MAYSRSPPISPSQEDWLSRGPQSIKTYSTGSSRSMSHASRSYSLASTASRAYTTAHYENDAKTYYLELKSYLTDLIAQENIEGPHPHRITARQKLVRLSNLQFHELSMDVYDEVVRRNKDDKYLPFLPVKEEFHPKRNQARQKLATLPIARFRDLASDVYFELTRRYNLVTENNNEYLPPIPQIPLSTSYSNDSTASIPQPSKSTNIIPTKGFINVENLEKFSDDEDIRSPDKSKFNRPGTSEYSRSKLEDEQTSSPTVNNDFEKMKSSYEFQINALTSRITQMQEDAKVLADKKEKQVSRSEDDKKLIEDLKMKEEEDQKIICQLEEQYKKLDDKFKQSELEYKQQQEAVVEVKHETKQLLEEMKNLAKVNEELMTEKEQKDTEIKKLNDEIKDWEMKYNKLRIEIRNMKASSLTDTDHTDNIIKDHYLQPNNAGIIEQDHILTYQAAINELLSVARSNNPSRIIHVMKKIVTICRSITQDIEIQEEDGQLSRDMENTLYDLKSQFSTALSDLLISAKHHANGMGISPASLLDRTAGNLTSVIVELAKLLGIKNNKASYSHESYSPIKKSDHYKENNIQHKSINGNQHDDIKSSRPQMDNYRTNPQYESQQKKPANNSIYNDYKKKTTSQDGLLTVSELTTYLKNETDSIVQTIQGLLSALRLPQQNGEVHAIITSLVKIVTTILELSRATCNTSNGYRYKAQCEPVLSQLGKCSQRLTYIQSKFFSRGMSATAVAKRDLAKEAYEIAKFTKELITLFETDYKN